MYYQFARTNLLAKDFLDLRILDVKNWVDQTYFSTLIPNHPAWRRVKMQPWGVVSEKLLLGYHVTSSRINGKKVSFLGRVRGWNRVRIMVLFGVLVRVRAWIWNQGTRAVKVISRDCSPASDLLKALSIIVLWILTSDHDRYVQCWALVVTGWRVRVFPCNTAYLMP